MAELAVAGNGDFAMMARLLLALALLAALSVSADAFRPHGSASPTLVPPPQAAAAGFTVLARNSDFRSAAPDIGCSVSDATPHDWYTHTDGAIYSECSDITWPATDPVTGETTAKFNCTNCGKPVTGFTGSRHGLTSVNQNGFAGDTFPQDGYYECRMRVDPYLFQGGWWNCWMNGAQAPQSGYAIAWLEYDINEYHSGEGTNKNYCGLNVIHDWWAGGPGASSYLACNTGLDPSAAMHTTGMLIQTNRAANNIHFCAYVDDVLKGCADYNPVDAGWKTQRNFLMWNVSVGCIASNETYGDCINTTIANVTNNGGNVRVAINGSATPTYGLPLISVDFDNFELSISGVTGTTNANGHFMGVPVDDPLTCSTNCRFDIFTIDTGTGGPGTPIAFNSAYTGGGIWNAAPSGVNMYASYFRVWTACTDWRTSDCVGPAAPVQRSNHAASNCDSSTTCAVNVIGSQAGDYRIVGLYYGRNSFTVSSSDVVSVQDNHGLVCTRVSPTAFRLSGDSHRASDIFKCPGVGAGSSTVTATMAQTQDALTVFVSEIYGSSIADAGIAAGNSGTGTTVSATTSGPVTQIGEYIYQVGVHGGGVTPVPGTGETPLNAFGGIFSQYKLTTVGSGTVTASATAGSSASWVDSVAAFTVVP